MSDMNLNFAGLLVLAALGDLFAVMVPLRNLPALPRFVMIGFALLMLVVAALQFTGKIRLIG